MEHNLNFPIEEVLGLVQDLLAHLSEILAFVSDINIAQDVDVEGGRSKPGSSSAEDAYLHTVGQARESLRRLELVVQAVYDDSSSIFILAQTIPFGWSSTISAERLQLIKKLDGLSALLSTDCRLILQSLRGLMDIFQEQMSSTNLFRESMALRMSRISMLDGDQRLSNFFGPLPPGTEEEEEEDVVDMEIAFRKPPARPVMDGFGVDSLQNQSHQSGPVTNGARGHMRNDSLYSDISAEEPEAQPIPSRHSEEDDLVADPILGKGDIKL